MREGGGLHVGIILVLYIIRRRETIPGLGYIYINGIPNMAIQPTQIYKDTQTDQQIHIITDKETRR